jgi:hypothetical protein
MAGISLFLEDRSDGFAAIEKCSFGCNCGGFVAEAVVA